MKIKFKVTVCLPRQNHEALVLGFLNIYRDFGKTLTWDLHALQGKKYSIKNISCRWYGHEGCNQSQIFRQFLILIWCLPQHFFRRSIVYNTCMFRIVLKFAMSVLFLSRQIWKQFIIRSSPMYFKNSVIIVIEFKNLQALKKPTDNILLSANLPLY